MRLPRRRVRGSSTSVVGAEALNLGYRIMDRVHEHRERAAREAGIETFVLAPRDFPDRPAWNRALEEKLASATERLQADEHRMAALEQQAQQLAARPAGQPQMLSCQLA